MPSLQYYLFKPLIRFARWAQGNFPTQDVSSFVHFRKLANYIANIAIHSPRDIQVVSESIGGVAGEWFIPRDVPKNPVMLFIHGGGIVFGWNNPLRRELAYLASFAGLRCFGVDYHTAPEYRYPIAHNECFAVFQTLLHSGKQIILIGESTGAVLALATMLRAKAARIPQPFLCVLISPIVEFEFKDANLLKFYDDFAHPKFVLEMHKHYVAGNDIKLPNLSPIYADLSGIAPFLVLDGKNEILRGEVDRELAATKRFDIPMETLFWPNVWHSWHALTPQLPEATHALEALGTAIRQRMIKYV